MTSHVRDLVAIPALVALAALAGCASADSSVPQQRASGESEPTASAVTEPGECPTPTVQPASADELERALDEARPGDVIVMAAGTYAGEFTASAEGTAEKPITLCGTSDAVLDGGAIDGGYVLHLDGAAHWVLQGFTVRNGQKGIMADATTATTIQGVTVTHIGDEGIHLRGGSTDNHVVGNTVSDTGLRKPKFGEGIYIGTAESNWCDISDCRPDPSDRNLIERNTISGTTSESVDIKEGTSDGILRENTFDGSAMTDADSWVDVKGNGWRIEGNTGTAGPQDGFQTHEIVDGWGTDNVFSGNSAALDEGGLGYALEPELGNILRCDNTVTGADAELSNVDCRD